MNTLSYNDSVVTARNDRKLVGTGDALDFFQPSSSGFTADIITKEI